MPEEGRGWEDLGVRAGQHRVSPLGPAAPLGLGSPRAVEPCEPAACLAWGRGEQRGRGRAELCLRGTGRAGPRGELPRAAALSRSPPGAAGASLQVAPPRPGARRRLRPRHRPGAAGVTAPRWRGCGRGPGTLLAQVALGLLRKAWPLGAAAPESHLVAAPARGCPSPPAFGTAKRCPGLGVPAGRERVGLARCHPGSPAAGGRSAGSPAEPPGSGRWRLAVRGDAAGSETRLFVLALGGERAL